MTHDFSVVFETENPYWQRVLEIFKKNEKYPKKRVSNRNLHHKFPRSFSKMLNEPVDNEPDNLISLTLAEHFLVHYYYYLVAKKGYRQRMATAFTFMAKKSLKYVTPETAEAIAKDYEEARSISEQYLSDNWTDEKRKEQSEKISKIKTEYYETHEIYNKGKSTPEEIKEKQRIALKEYCNKEEVKKYRSEQQKGKPHPHKSGRKGIPLSKFGKGFYEHYGFLAKENNKLYRKEFEYWKTNNCFSWEVNPE